MTSELLNAEVRVVPAEQAENEFLKAHAFALGEINGGSYPKPTLDDMPIICRQFLDQTQLRLSDYERITHLERTLRRAFDYFDHFVHNAIQGKVAGLGTGNLIEMTGMKTVLDPSSPVAMPDMTQEDMVALYVTSSCAGCKGQNKRITQLTDVLRKANAAMIEDFGDPDDYPDDDGSVAAGETMTISFPLMREIKSTLAECTEGT